MLNESRELQRLHEGFRFFSYLLLFVALYISQLPFFIEKGLYIPEFSAVTEKLLRIRFLGDTVLARTVCVVFLVTTCIGTKAQKDRDLKVSNIVIQVLIGLVIFWGSLLVLKTPFIYLLLSFFGFVLLNIGFDNISKLINVNLMKDRFNLENESFPQEQAYEGNGAPFVSMNFT